MCSRARLERGGAIPQGVERRPSTDGLWIAAIEAAARRASWQAASTKSFWSAIWARTRRSADSNSGDQVVNFTLATSENWRDKTSGERKEKTEWHNVVIFNENLGKVVEQYCKKGSKVYVEGKLQTRKWQDKDGHDRYTTEIVLQRFRGELTLLNSRAAAARVATASPRKGLPAAQASTAPRRASAALRFPAAAGAARARSTTTFRSERLPRPLTLSPSKRELIEA